jgi:hypothetical protein
MLRDFSIRNFRGFKDLQIPKLGRVNLIVGKNSVGKSSVLEAVRIYASNGLPEVLWDAVTSRDEHTQNKRAGRALVGLFHDDADIQDGIEIGPNGETIVITIQFRRASPAEDGTVQYTLLENPGEDDLVGARIDLVVKSESGQTSLPLMRDFETYLRRSIGGVRRDQLRMEPLLRNVFVAANGLTPERQAELWDEVTLSSLEEDVIASLRLITPNLDRVSLIGTKDERGRSPFVKLKTVDNPIPLRRLGDGVTRVFGMALALVSSKGGVLLIDEIENGIHYSVQENLWRFILDVSKRLNVQVFATSHSWDCLKAFQRATAECHSEEGILTRLEFANGSIRASQFDEPELAIATRENIEIR